ncbi:putative azaleucine resistance protein AzlC [Oribacterium sp. oral taxon 108 str. F0425]|nr:AzlC family ABC transporter permease [Oribacterium sp. oral taxon 108]EGL36702.1 putative azaleucine resistance protein AzlC [Oribacterium sp. oral taxon 108 str. F0425]
MSEKQKKALKAAFPHTIPILTGFLFLGFAYGVYMHSAGLSVLYTFFMASLIFGGSLEILAVSFLLSPFAPLETFFLAVMIQLRHLFYGIAMLDKFPKTGWKRFYLIFGMCDETFSINYSAEIPEDTDPEWFMFFVTLLNQSYWVIGSCIGTLLGNVLPFSTEGIDFVMTALFAVIFMDQFLKEKIIFLPSWAFPFPFSLSLFLKRKTLSFPPCSGLPLFY